MKKVFKILVSSSFLLAAVLVCVTLSSFTFGYELEGAKFAVAHASSAMFSIIVWYEFLTVWKPAIDKYERGMK